MIKEYNQGYMISIGLDLSRYRPNSLQNKAGKSYPRLAKMLLVLSRSSYILFLIKYTLTSMTDINSMMNQYSFNML
jgi:hypothetical protein